MIIKKEHAASVDRLFKMTTSGPSEVSIIKELATEYLGPAQVAVTCFSCPGSIQNLYKMLCQTLTGYTVEEPKQKEDEKTNEPIGPGIAPVNKKQNKKRFDNGPISSGI